MAPQKTSRSASAQPRPYFLINQLQLAMVSRLEKSLQPLGLTPAIGRVLNAIAIRPKISSSALARMLGITPQSIKQSVIILEEMGLIERKVSEQDHRVMAAQLTAKGWQVRERHMVLIAEMYEEVFGSMTNREVDTMVRLMTKAVTNARPQAMDYFASKTPAAVD